jgi:hypothetical protein
VATIITNLINTSYPNGYDINVYHKFIGYSQPGTGWAGSMRILRFYAEEYCKPIWVVCVKNGSSAADAFVEDINDDTDYVGGRYML